MKAMGMLFVVLGGRNCRFCCLGRKPIYPPLFTSPSGDNFILGNLSNDDGDGNENGKNTIGLISKTTILHVHHAFLYISLPSLHNYDVKPPNFTFYGGRDHKTTIFVFFL